MAISPGPTGIAQCLWAGRSIAPEGGRGCPASMAQFWPREERCRRGIGSDLGWAPGCLPLLWLCEVRGHRQCWREGQRLASPLVHTLFRGPAWLPEDFSRAAVVTRHVCAMHEIASMKVSRQELDRLHKQVPDPHGQQHPENGKVCYAEVLSMQNELHVLRLLQSKWCGIAYHNRTSVWFVHGGHCWRSRR